MVFPSPVELPGTSPPEPGTEGRPHACNNTQYSLLRLDSHCALTRTLKAFLGTYPGGSQP